MTIIRATTILHSCNIDQDHEVPSLWQGLLTYPRCIHAELLTHRVFSKNSASSRAIPVKRLIQDVIDHPYVPIKWSKNAPGMKESAYFEGAEKQALIDQWLSDRDEAVQKAWWYEAKGVHKQVVNRILEPYAHITVFLSGTAFSNFFGLRLEGAEPHFEMLAAEIHREYTGSPRQLLRPGEWALPWVKPEDYRRFSLKSGQMHPDLIKLSIARSAHTSYQTVDGKEMTYDLAINLADRIIDSRPLHASPTEHQARADRFWRTANNSGWEGAGLEGNFDPGWVQFRKTLPNERL